MKSLIRAEDVATGVTVMPSAVIAERSHRLRVLKRMLDVTVALTTLMIVSPLLIVIAVAVRSTLGPGSPLLVQRRVGKDGETFEFLKFRTMLQDRRVANLPYDGPDRRMTHKSEDDPRHRPFGRFLRSTSLDELPQLFNVLRGDMSLVGPRPELESVAAENGIIDHPRHQVRPGLTGLFQVSELRRSGDLMRGLHLDLDYVMDPGIRRDMRILAKTVVVMFRRTGC